MIACFVVLLLFLHPLHHQDSGWVALCGAMGIMLLGSNADLHHTLLHVEWDTLLFFAGLFVMIAAMAELGLIRWIGDQIVSVIMSAPKGNLFVLFPSVVILSFFIKQHGRAKTKNPHFHPVRVCSPLSTFWTDFSV